jgi:hypothetical protein
MEQLVDRLVRELIYNHLVVDYPNESPRRGREIRAKSTARKGDAVSATVLYMSMSLDGFIAGPNEGPDNGLGDGGHRLHEWAMTGDGAVDLEALRRSGGVNGNLVDEFMSTGGHRRRPGHVRACRRLGRRPPRRRRSGSSAAASPAST